MPPTAPAPVAAGFDRPIFLLSSPRSGSTLLFQTLRKAPCAYSIGGESHTLIETVPGLHPAQRGWHSNRLTAADLTPAVAEELARRFRFNLVDRDGRRAPPSGRVRMIEKTPKNSVRVPFLHTLFPDAAFIFLYRDWRQTIASIIEAWASGRFVTYPRLPDWPPPAWSLLLVPGWEALRGRPPAEIAARQWSTALDMLLDDLESRPAATIAALDYDDLVAAPDDTMRALCAAVDLGWDVDLGCDLPLSPTTLTRPDAEKWRRHERAILAMEPLVAETDARARAFMARYAIGR